MLGAGTRLGPYEIVEPIGSGGMGEVYRARDGRLDRFVALKVLPAFANDESRRRFHTEARLASAVTHRNIVVVYDVGEDNGVPFIAMELVEGGNLRTRGDTAMPVDRLLKIAVQIADALRVAHNKGLAHRDLKPENVLLTSDDDVKLVDFGLAKVASSDVDATVGGTQSGLVLGTPGYMSPEQAKGLPSDWRSDQFSLGALLYELATGRRAFQRSSLVETANAAITDEPTSASELRPDLPQPLVWTIQRCLAKDPLQRYAATEDLYRDLAAIREHVAIPAAPSLSRSNVTPDAPVLVGRANDLVRLIALLEKPHVRWVTVTGPGGVGKTSLAQHVAVEAEQKFGGRRFVVALGSITEPALVIGALARTLGATTQGTESEQDALVRLLSAMQEPVLVVLDNFEHLASAAGAVASLLVQARTLKVLATSRALLRLSNEYEYSLEPLDLSSAVALFIDRAGAAVPGFHATQTDTASIGTLCERLGRVPLAIELAAARVKLLPPKALLGRLEGRLLSLTGGARDVPERQQTLRRTVDWSFELLNAEEQRLFRRLGVFVGSWTLDAAEAVCDARQDLGVDILVGMASLVEKSLINRIAKVSPTEDEPRFTMLEVLREYAIERLDEADEGAHCRLAHAAYYVVLGEEGASGTELTANQEWLARCDAEMANIRRALAHLVSSGRTEWALRLASSLFPYWQDRGSLIEGEAQLSTVTAMTGALQLPALRASALFCLMSITHSRGDYADAVRLAGLAIEAFERLGDRRSVAAAYNGLAIAFRDGGHYSEAERGFKEAISLWQEQGDPGSAARGLSNLASVSLRAGRHDDARRQYVECRELFARIGDDAGVTWTLQHEGDAARDGGQPTSAAELYQEAHDRFEHAGDHWGISSAQTALGDLALDKGDRITATQLFTRALETTTAIGNQRGIARLLDAFARVAVSTGEHERALRLAGAAAALRQKIGAHLPDNERKSLERALTEARQIQHAAKAWLDGSAMSVHRAANYALKIS